MSRYERLILIHALQANGFSRSRCARSLKVSRVHLWRRMKALSISFDELPAVRPGRPRRA